MHQALKDAVSLCKTFLRNGYDAHVINAPLQEQLLLHREDRSIAPVIDIACEPNFETILMLFPNAVQDSKGNSLAIMEDKGLIYRFYPLEANDSAHPELSLLRVTDTMLEQVTPVQRQQMRLGSLSAPVAAEDAYDGFAEVKDGSIRLLGLPDETLRHNYLLAIRALRFAANFDVPIDPNTWMAIVRAATRVLDYVPAGDIMEEWRKVAAESMHRFVRLLYEAHILQGLVPEVAALSCVVQQNDKGVINGNVFEHTLKCMELYPQEGMHYDWLGAMGMLFHDVGKLYTAEYFDGRWTYYQHHRVGAKVTRKILRRLHFDRSDIELICHLVNQHMRFHFMMTDRGMRRFTAVGETDRLIAMAKADLLARDDSFTSFNHNIKYLERAATPEQLIEPLLNGNRIMAETHLAPGPQVGIIRDALLEAQRLGRISDKESALKFVREYAARLADCE